jgi:large subunit ribosomal protein L18
MRTEQKLELAIRRHWRVRKKVIGTSERPRMSVCFTGENIYVQFIDDQAGRTLASTSSLSKAVPDVPITFFRTRQCRRIASSSFCSVLMAV